jgi:hypothetical protein
MLRQSCFTIDKGPCLPVAFAQELRARMASITEDNADIRDVARCQDEGDRLP